jgi:hypothetical protein
MSNDEIKKENNPRKRMLNYINFRILWPESLDKKKIHEKTMKLNS